MARNQLWFTVPQAVVFEATGEIKLAMGLQDNDPDMLVIKANQLIASHILIPLEVDADEDRRLEAVRKFQEAKAAWRRDDRYLQAQQRVYGRLVAGVTTKARMTANGPWENVDPLELTRVELYGVHAVDKTTRTVSLHHLRVNMSEYIESQQWSPTGATSVSSDGPLAINTQLSHEPEKWDCRDDPVPKLIEWARSRWGDDLSKLPSRSELLRIFREQHGRVLGINEKTMREVRNQLAPEEARRGGAPRHHR
jgi:hypothetical protein